MNDAYQLDKRQVRLAFDRAAQGYDAHAVLQAEVREQMLERLPLMQHQASCILDLGCGTGRAGRELARHYPQAQCISLDLAPAMLQQARQHHGRWRQWWPWQRRYHYLCADMEQLPLADASVDMVWSNLAIQWCNDLDQVLRELKRVLKPEGLLMFSSFGPDTLKELRLASQQVDGHVHVSRFIDMHDVGDALVRAGFAGVVLDVDHFTLQYAQVTDLMRDLKAIGAHNAAQGRRKGLAGRQFMQQLCAAYEPYRQAQGLPATYEVVYGHAWRPQQRPSTKFDIAQPVTFHQREPAP